MADDQHGQPWVDHYAALGLARGASAAAIKKAWRQLARQHHPDRNPSAGANDRMAAINQAHEVLGDPAQRAAYDALGPDGRAGRPRAGRGGASGGPGFDFSAGWPGAEDGAGQGDDGDGLFEQLLRRARRPARPAMPRAGDDVQAAITLPLTDAYQGGVRHLTITGADGQTLRLAVTVPIGLHAGQQIRLAGQGGPGVAGGPPGDLLLTVGFSADARWRAEGRDVLQPLPLMPWQAALGATVRVDTPGGQADVVVPAGWQGGRRLRLKGRGIPATASQAAGHLVLLPEVQAPAADTEAQRAAYAALAAAFGDSPR